MVPSPPPTGARIVVLSGAGLSRASGIPTFRDSDGLWRRHPVEELASPLGWRRGAETVRAFYDERRVGCAHVVPNPGHEALARLQQRWGTKRVVLVTQNVDGLLQKAGAPDVIEMHGSLWRLRCEHDPDHPAVQVAGAQDPAATCAICSGRMRPAVVWFGEQPRYMDRIYVALSDCALFISVGTSGVVYPAAGFVQIARAAGARCIEINPVPSGGAFHEVIAEPSEAALPAMIADWLGEDD